MAATFERPSVTTALARAMIEAAVAQAGLTAISSLGDAHVH